MSAIKFDPVLGRFVRPPRAERRRATRVASKIGPERNLTLHTSCITDDRGNVKHLAPLRHNLRTNIGLDWQASVMADYRSFGAAASAPTSNATSTTLTDTGQSWTTDQWKGHFVVFATSAGAMGFGVCLSNTGTVLTVDGWWRIGTPGSSAITGPLTTGFYGILGGGAPHWWMALSTTVQSGAVGDTTLAGEITDSGLARALPTSFTHTASATSYSISKTYTASGTKTINSNAEFDAQNGGRMPFESAEPNPPTLVSGDTLAQTETTNY